VILERERDGAAPGYGEALVQDVLGDLDASPLGDQEKELLRFVDKVNRDSPRIGPGDLDRVRAAGWADDAIYFAITVCALFNFYNRWIDASGVHVLSDDAHRQGCVRSANSGYVRK
jgi:alkylhydroperoxidase family enzyme